jgi:uncharacterized protein (TIGR00369 family)
MPYGRFYFNQVKNRMNFEPKDSEFAEKIHKSFAAQEVMKLIGARLIKIEPGEIEIKLPYRKDLTQQNGFLHAGITAAIADSACGYAAFSLMPAGTDVLTIEFKINLLSPAVGDYFVAQGRILRTGKALTVAAGDVFAVNSNEKKPIATILATVMCVARAGL